MSTQPLLRVLVVDDNRDLADSVAEILSDKGHFVRVAYRGDKAIELSHEHDFDLCLLDIHLPDVNGFDLFHLFHSENPDITIIMITGYRIEQLVAKMLNRDSNIAILQKFDTDIRCPEALSNILDENIVLVAENTTNVTTQIRDALHSTQLRSHISHTGDEAINACQHGLFDALILDMGKPIVCALGVYLTLEKQSLPLPTVIVAPKCDLTPNSNPMREINITGCLFKPFAPEAILDAIEHLALLRCDKITLSNNKP